MEAHSLDNNHNSMNMTQSEMVELLAKALPQFRANLGISQQALGDKINVSRQTISSIERGEYQMPWNTFLAIIYFLKVNSGEIKPDRMTDVDRYLLVNPDGKQEG